MAETTNKAKEGVTPTKPEVKANTSPPNNNATSKEVSVKSVSLSKTQISYMDNKKLVSVSLMPQEVITIPKFAKRQLGRYVNAGTIKFI